MTDDTNITTPHFGPKIYGIALIIFTLIIVGLWSMSRYVATDLARDLQNWNEKLDIIAQSKSADISSYIKQHFDDLHKLAENPSLQLYMTELEMMPTEASTTSKPSEPAQLSYLRNLIIFTAERNGYTTSQPVNRIPANIKQEQGGALAVINNAGEILVSTSLPEDIKSVIERQAASDTDTKFAFIDMDQTVSGKRYIGFIVPVFSIQGNQDQESLIGRVIAIKAIGEGFFDRLKYSDPSAANVEVFLVRNKGGMVDFLSPTSDIRQPLTGSIDFRSKANVESYHINNTGTFTSEIKDHKRRLVLATSRDIDLVPWTLITKTPYDTALKASTERRNSMIAIFFLILAVIILLVIAIWWHGTSKRSLMLSTHYRKLAQQSMAQEKLLQLIADNVPEAISIIDKNYHYLFANQKAATETNMSIEHIPGKHIQDVLGTARAADMIVYSNDAIRQGSMVKHTIKREGETDARTIHSSFVPLSHVPIGGRLEQSDGVLIVEQDITDVIREREKRIKINQDLINTVLMIVDKRDPYAANHSTTVSELAQYIAKDMELDDITCETARIAASVMNIGKIVVPTTVLTKNTSLTEEEKQVIRDSLADAAELVKHIHFEGPVYDTLKQWQEKWDGSGPLGIKGDAILFTARILAVANSFVGMISPRSWRHAIDEDTAIKFLMNNSDTLFDRRVVGVLVHFLESSKGKEWLEEVKNNRPTS